MAFFKTNTNIDFMAQRRIAAIFSVLICVVSLVVLAFDGLNLGLDFVGGTQIELRYDKAADFNLIREKVTHAGFPEAVVQPYGSSRDVLIRLADHPEMNQKELKGKILSVLPDAHFSQAEYIGPQVGKTLVTNGILAILVSLLGTMLYIAMRFEYRFAVSAAVALLHDPIVSFSE